MENTKKTKKKVRTKGQKIRSIIMMALLCIAMLSGATYAWFTLSDTARVTNMQLTVGEASGLLISDAEKGEYTSSVNFPSLTGCKFLPAGSINGTEFKAPQYGVDGDVTGVAGTATKITTDANGKKEGHYYEWKFWLKAGVNTTVKLSDGKGIPNNGFIEGASNVSGTYLLDEKNPADGLSAASAVRISLEYEEADSTKKVIVYEPLSDYTKPEGVTVTQANPNYNNYTCVSSNYAQKTGGGYGEGNLPTISLIANTPKKITMRIWIEGSDPQCVNEISAASLKGQIQFESDAKKTTSDTNS